MECIFAAACDTRATKMRESLVGTSTPAMWKYLNAFRDMGSGAKTDDGTGRCD